MHTKQITQRLEQLYTEIQSAQRQDYYDRLRELERVCIETPELRQIIASLPSTPFSFDECGFNLMYWTAMNWPEGDMGVATRWDALSQIIATGLTPEITAYLAYSNWRERCTNMLVQPVYHYLLNQLRDSSPLEPRQRKEPIALRKAVEQLDEPLWHQLEVIWRRAQEGIHDAQRSQDGHQQGFAHCSRVEENLAKLIPDNWKGAPFTATDLFILSAAAALHDAGKANDSPDSPDNHGHISRREIVGRAMTFGLDEGQATAVGWLAQMHDDGNLEALPSDPVPLGTVTVNIRLLAALLKLADMLDTDYRRVSRQVVEFGGKQAADNSKTLFRQRVQGWSIKEGGHGIELYAVPQAQGDATVIQAGFEMMCRELETVAPTLREAGFPWELALHMDEVGLR